MSCTLRYLDALLKQQQFSWVFFIFTSIVLVISHLNLLQLHAVKTGVLYVHNIVFDVQWKTTQMSLSTVNNRAEVCDVVAPDCWRTEWTFIFFHIFEDETIRHDHWSVTSHRSKYNSNSTLPSPHFTTYCAPFSTRQSVSHGVEFILLCCKYAAVPVRCCHHHILKSNH